MDKCRTIILYLTVLCITSLFVDLHFNFLHTRVKTKKQTALFGNNCEMELSLFILFYFFFFCENLREKFQFVRVLLVSSHLDASHQALPKSDSQCKSSEYYIRVHQHRTASFFFFKSTENKRQHQTLPCSHSISLLLCVKLSYLCC